MAEQQDDALLLRSIPYSDSSLILHCLTANHGRINLMARGARRSKSPFRASLMPLYQLHIRWKKPRTGNLGILLEVHRLQALLPETKILAGQALLSKASKLFPDGVQHGYDELTHALKLLSDRSESSGLPAAIWSMLEAAGWIGDLKHCWHCAHPIDDTQVMYWLKAHLLCHTCAEQQGVRLSSGYRKSMAASMQHNNIKLTSHDIKTWNTMIHDMMQSHPITR